MRQMSSKQWVNAAIVSLTVAIVMGLGCTILIHNAGSLIELLGEAGGLGDDTATYAQIFGQLKYAEVDLPSVILLLMCVGMTTGLRQLVRGKSESKTSKKSRVLRFVIALVISAVGLLLILLITLWFTDVNGIRFGTVFRFLYSALQSGVF